jgi:hypothetical protein
MYILRSYKNLSFKKKALPKKHVFFGKKKIKIDSHRDHRAHRGKKLGALGVLGGKKYTLFYIP